MLASSWSWAGLIFALAVMRGDHQLGRPRAAAARTWLLAVLALAAVAGPLEQARLHTAASLNKHVGLGAWFAAIAAGYAIDRFIAAAPAGRAQRLTTGACVVALTFPAVLGASQSWQFSTSWPNATSFIAVFRPLADHSTGPCWSKTPPSPSTTCTPDNWRRWSSTRNIVLPSGASTGHPTSQGIVGAGNPAIFARYIAEGYFSLVALNFADTTPLDHAIATDLRQPPLQADPGRPLRHRGPAHRPGHLRHLPIRARPVTAATGQPPPPTTPSPSPSPPGEDNAYRRAHLLQPPIGTSS